MMVQEMETVEREKILVVDDDRLLRAMAKDILSQGGHPVEEAENAHKALALIQKEHFPLIILDIMMPEITGIELMEQIRKIDPDTLIIVVTAYATMDLAIDALKKGAYDFLKKPFEPEEFLKSVSNALLQSRTSRRNRDLLRELEDKVLKLSQLNIEIEKGKATLQQIMESISTGIVVTDREGRFLRLNSAARKILGVREKGDGRKLQVPAKSYKQLMAIINSGPPEDNLVDQISIGAQQPAFYQVIISPLKDNQGKIVGRVATLEDVTDLNRVLTMESEFIARASHDLRTPLTAIAGAAELLTGGKVQELPPLQQKMLRIIAEETKKLGSLISDVIDASKMAAGILTFKIEEGDPHAPVSQAIESMRPLFEKKGLELSFNRSPEKRFACFDPRRLEQVVSNLLSNALKYTPKRGRVAVTISDPVEGTGEEARKKYFKVSVSDSGSGISPALKDKIFDRFKLMGSQEIREAGGLGIGLPLSKFIVENLGGRIWVESEEGKGTTFHFTIPCFRKEA